MSIETPLVSAIVSAYNSEIFFKGKIEDLLNQTILDKLEIIIINSGSKQGEEEVYKKYFSGNSSIKYIRTEERETIYSAWNRGIKVSTGKYITNSNTDDRLRRDALKILADELERNPNAALVYAEQYRSHIPNELFTDIKKKKRMNIGTYTPLRLLDGYMIGSQPMWRSSLHFKDNIWFDGQYEVAGDYDFVCKISEKYKILKIDEYLGTYYISKSGENKELQNPSHNTVELLHIRARHSQSFINNISDEHIKKINILYYFYSFIPSKVFSLFRNVLYKISRDLKPYEINFIVFLKILLEERKGNIKRVKRIVSLYKKKPLINEYYRKYFPV